MEIKLKQIYAVGYSGQYVGTDALDLVVAESVDEAIELMTPTAYEWYENWTDEDDYDEDGELLTEGPDIWAEVYDPDKHDCLMPGGGPSEKYIAQLRMECEE
jgi:hypothetical protein